MLILRETISVPAPGCLPILVLLYSHLSNRARFSLTWNSSCRTLPYRCVVESPLPTPWSGRQWSQTNLSLLLNQEYTAHSHLVKIIGRKKNLSSKSAPNQPRHPVGLHRYSSLFRGVCIVKTQLGACPPCFWSIARAVVQVRWTWHVDIKP